VAVGFIARSVEKQVPLADKLGFRNHKNRA
jgi:hypothetical protein